MAKQLDPEQKLAKLDEALAGMNTLLIVMQDNPDPDAIAAAAALREIANTRHGVGCSLAHGGTIGRSENVALIRYLGLNSRSIAEIDPKRYQKIAVVDAQPGAGNLTLPLDRTPDIVIDHHPIRRETRAVPFSDVRSRYGATSSMLHEYLVTAGIEIPTKLATALLYGIRSDTQDLGRDSTRADVEAFLALYPAANPRALGRIVSAPLPRMYFADLRRALDSAVLYGERLVSHLGLVENQEIVAETADLLLRAEGVTWVLCSGSLDSYLHLSLRTLDEAGHAGQVASKLAGRHGRGGGHRSLAGAQIPLDDARGSRRDPEKLLRRLVTRFLKLTGPNSTRSEPLCPDKD